MIEAVYTVTAEEHAESQKLWCTPELKKLPGRRLLLAVSTALGVCIGLSLSRLPWWLALAMALSLASIWTVTLWRKKALKRYQYLLKQADLSNVHARIDDEGYHSERAGESSCWMGWRSFSGWRESAGVIVLGRHLTYITLPKSAFTTEQQEELRALLRRNIVAAE